MKKLSRNEMKNVVGGKHLLNGGSAPECQSAVVNEGGSCWHDADWYHFQCGLTQAQAQAHGGTWCTASCLSSCMN
jgi:hypothetical protein